MSSKVSFAVVIVAVLVFTATTDARKDAGEYWVSIMKEEPMPEAIDGLLHVINPASDQPSLTSLPKGEEADCHGDNKLEDDKRFAGDFEPRPNIFVYGDDANLKEKKFAEDFEPRPNISGCGEDSRIKEKNFSEDFEPRPNISADGGDAQLKEKKSFAKDFEPRPNIWASGQD